MEKPTDRDKNWYERGYKAGYDAGLKRASLNIRQHHLKEYGLVIGLLTNDQVANIKMQSARYNAKPFELAETYKVPMPYIEAILNGDIYANIRRKDQRRSTFPHPASSATRV
jgi:hypothetical protein